MKKYIIIIAIILGVLLIREIGLQIETKAARNYYEALVNEDYERAFQYLSLYEHGVEATTDEDAKKFYLKKTKFLKDQGYKVIDYKMKSRREDGQDIGVDVKITIQIRDNSPITFTEHGAIHNGKLFIFANPKEPYQKYRDGRMNIKIQ